MNHNGRRVPSVLFLALLPGFAVLLVTIARLQLGRTLAELWESVPLALAAALLALSWWRHRTLTPWSLPAFGYLMVAAPAALADFLPVNAANVFSILWPIGSIAAAVFLLWRLWRFDPLPRTWWLLLGLALLVQPSGLILCGIWLLPAAVSLHLARRLGSLAVLVCLAALYWPVAEIFDPAYAILIWSDETTIQGVLTLLPALLFLVMTPAGLLVARTRPQEALAVLLPVAAGLLAAEIWRSALFAATTRGGYDVAMWIIRGGFIAQFSLLLAWVLVSCWKRGRRTPAAQTNAPPSPIVPYPQP